MATRHWKPTADGHSSPVREALGIERGGRGHMRTSQSVLFRAPLEEYVRDGTTGRWEVTASIADEYLAWKLAAVLNNESLPDLLDTYEAERLVPRPGDGLRYPVRVRRDHRHRNGTGQATGRVGRAAGDSCAALPGSPMISPFWTFINVTGFCWQNTMTGHRPPSRQGSR